MSSLDRLGSGAPSAFDYGAAVRGFEGFRSRPYWDHRQWSVGYGTRASGPDDFVDESEARRRFDAHFGRALAAVDAFKPGLDVGTRHALASLTYNAGDAWTRSGLGAAIRAGDLDRARASFLQYVNASGQPNPGLRDRRAQEVAWFGGGSPPPATTPPVTVTLATSPSAAPRMALGGPQPTSSAPMAEPSTLWIPEDNIARTDRAAQNLWRIDPGTGRMGGLAAALSALGSGVLSTSANAATLNNQTLRGNTMRSAASAPDNISMGRVLMAGGVPGLEDMGLKTIAGVREKEDERRAALAQLEEKLKLEARIKREDEARRLALLGFGPATPTPAGATPAPAAATITPAAVTAGASGGPVTDLLSTYGRPSGVATVTPTPPPASRPAGGGITGAVDEDKRRRAALAYVMGDAKRAAEILSEAPDKDGTKAYDTELGKGLAKDMNELRDAARKSQSRLAMLGVLKQLSESNTPQGPGTQYELMVRRLAGAVGIPTEGLSNAQMFNALASQLSLELRDPSSGAGMPGAMSDKDREFLTAMAPNLSMTPDGNRMLIEYMSRVAKRNVDVARLANNYAQRNGGRIDDRFFDLLGQWSEANPLFPESATAMPAASQRPAGAPAAPTATTRREFAGADEIPEGTRVRDPATGERLIKRNGVLVPVTDPTVVPSAPGSRAAQAQERRIAEQRAASEQTAAIKREFDADMAKLTPLEVIRKYDGMRASLTSDQLARLNEMVSRL